jgi:hypothetical protein
MDIPDWSVLGERTKEYLFQVLPAAASSVYEFAKEWQTLIAALLVVLAARYFFNAMLRSSRLMAEAVIHSARIAADSTTAPRKMPAPREIAPVSTLLGSAAGQVPASANLGDRLESLRDAVRSALAAIPTSGNEIGIKGAALYGRVATFTFDDLDPGDLDRGTLSVFRELQTCLDALRLDSGDADARQAWERLVRINKLARDLRAKAVPEKPGKLEKTIVKKIG